MPRYPRKAYCLDKGEPQTKENSQNKVEEQEKEKLLEESNDEKIGSVFAKQLHEWL